MRFWSQSGGAPTVHAGQGGAWMAFSDMSTTITVSLAVCVGSLVSRPPEQREHPGDSGGPFALLCLYNVCLLCGERVKCSASKKNKKDEASLCGDMLVRVYHFGRPSSGCPPWCRFTSSDRADSQDALVPGQAHTVQSYPLHCISSREAWMFSRCQGTTRVCT